MVTESLIAFESAAVAPVESVSNVPSELAWEVLVKLVAEVVVEIVSDWLTYVVVFVASVVHPSSRVTLDWEAAQPLENRSELDGGEGDGRYRDGDHEVAVDSFRTHERDGLLYPVTKLFSGARGTTVLKVNVEGAHDFREEYEHKLQKELGASDVNVEVSSRNRLVVTVPEMQARAVDDHLDRLSKELDAVLRREHADE